MTDTFSPPRAATSQSSLTVELRTVETTFGDGYTQRGSDSLNIVGRTWTAVWPSLSAAEAAEIESFFVDHKGTIAFLWKGPCDTETMKYRCKTWQRSFAGKRLSLSATMERVFDL